MRTTITHEFSKTFNYLEGVTSRTTWEELFNKFIDSSEWETSVSTSKNETKVIFSKEGKEDLIFIIDNSKVLDKNEDLDMNTLAYELMCIVKVNKLYKKPRKPRK